MGKARLKSALYLLHNTYGPPSEHFWIENGKICRKAWGEGEVIKVTLEDADVKLILRNRLRILSKQVDEIKSFLDKQ